MPKGFATACAFSLNVHLEPACSLPIHSSRDIASTPSSSSRLGTGSEPHTLGHEDTIRWAQTDICTVVAEQVFTAAIASSYEQYPQDLESELPAAARSRSIICPMNFTFASGDDETMTLFAAGIGDACMIGGRSFKR